MSYSLIQQVFTEFHAYIEAMFSAWEILILGCLRPNDSSKTGNEGKCGICESSQICDNLHNKSRDHLLKMIYNEEEQSFNPVYT